MFFCDVILCTITAFLFTHASNTVFRLPYLYILAVGDPCIYSRSLIYSKKHSNISLGIILVLNTESVESIMMTEWRKTELYCHIWHWILFRSLRVMVLNANTAHTFWRKFWKKQMIFVLLCFGLSSKIAVEYIRACFCKFRDYENYLKWCTFNNFFPLNRTPNNRKLYVMKNCHRFCSVFLSICHLWFFAYDWIFNLNWPTLLKYYLFI